MICDCNSAEECTATWGTKNCKVGTSGFPLKSIKTESQNRPIVFVDMDGVIADLDSGIKNMFGVEEPESSRDRLFKEFLPAYTEAEMFFKQDMLRNAQELIAQLSMMYHNGWINLAMCTSTGQFYRPVSTVRDQKGKWLEYHFPSLVDIPFCTTTSGRDKAILAHPRAFLVDDHAPNVEKFIAAGGHGRIYNSKVDTDVADTIDSIYKAFEFDY